MTKVVFGMHSPAIISILTVVNNIIKVDFYFQLESSYLCSPKFYINDLQYFIYMHFQIIEFRKYSLPEKALKSLPFSEFW